jgi:predicted glycosyltransferase
MTTQVVTGPLMPAADRATLEHIAARHSTARIIDFHPHLQSAMAGARAVVTMGGYNTLTEAVLSGAHTIVVPRQHPRLEQSLRAQLFAERGLVDTVSPGPDLARRITQALAGGPSDPLSVKPIDFGGLDRLADVLLAPQRRNPLSHISTRAVVGDRLEKCLPA